MRSKNYLILFLFLLALAKLGAQEENPTLKYNVPSQNLLKFNRFLINPTFSTVREDKSYINLLHRNQSVSFSDNNQDYFLSYSGRMNDRSGLGLSLFSQREGLISNYGVMANYAYGIKLADNSNFTFGANLAYYNSGFDRGRANALDQNDPALNGLQEGSLLSFQPGFNLSFNQFDFGVFAENLFDYNISENISNTQFKEKTFSAHLQYTHQFKNEGGLLHEARLMPLARVRAMGEEEVVLGGSLILDLPKLGWLQGGYDSFYGASAGIGFNLNRRVSIGYTMEKGLTNNFDNLGLTHEISFAFSITPTLTEDRVMLEDKEDELVAQDKNTDEVPSLRDLEIEKLKKALAENDEILAELMFRQDSLEENRQKDLERRFELVMKMVKNETQGKRPDLENKAQEIFLFNAADKNATLAKKNNSTSKIPNSIVKASIPKDIVAAKSDIKKDHPSQNNNLTEADEFTEIAKKHQIKSKKFRDLPGVSEGYYLVANVYKGEKYLNQFVNSLTQEGLRADYFENPSNALKYVYLERYNTWQEALAAHKSSLDGNYTGDMWIMNVDNSSYTDKAYVNNVHKIKEKSSRYSSDQLQKNVVVKDKVKANDPKAKMFKINGVGSGYYIIVNVFANANNANKFVKLLNAQGLSASYFINPDNNYRYVYLKKHESWNNALVSYYSKLNDTYSEKMWIMRVTPNGIT
ncbi:PorP/SprF family type IX secretion system membrane protein [Arenibacter sp. 6A1]|uniref:PorP/SprF family type IX secretion system membrane protein n=1 Tax=Arenibacter sp. 6A1 TaxID=2720391 RepID=UPI0014469874|nr:type IX secretion system membrane protein PorP/SprF [Arenibacter sp. 6A1]NKI27922.1 PorP/SprF family type IX secretion system membrane protein [Arenibacter sp. 6A1]